MSSIFIFRQEREMIIAQPIAININGAIQLILTMLECEPDSYCITTERLKLLRRHWIDLDNMTV